MSVAKTWHQRRTHAVNNRLCSTARTAAEPRRSLCDLFDAVALNRNFAGIRIFAGAIENAHVGEEYAARSIDSVEAVRHRHSSCFRAAVLIRSAFHERILYHLPSCAFRCSRSSRAQSRGRSNGVQ